MFERELKFLESKLNVPYPERKELLREVEFDLEHTVERFRKMGLPTEKARSRALSEIYLSEDVMVELEEIHKSTIKKILDQYPVHITRNVYDFVGMIPTMILFVILYKEVPVMEFLREGGLIIYGILALGLFGVAVQLKSMFRWWVVRDHSKESLSITRLPMFVGFALFALGILGTAVAYYVVFLRWSDGALSEADFRIGMREPIPCLIIGSSMAALIFMIQGTMEHWLRKVRI